MRISYPLELQINRCDRPKLTSPNVIYFEVVQSLPEPQQHQEAKGNEARKYDSVPSLFRTDATHQTVDARYLASCTDYPPVDVRQSLSLHAKVLPHSVRLAQY
jgi:hypothetical protein